jgi:hypothetical protein
MFSLNYTKGMEKGKYLETNVWILFHHLIDSAGSLFNRECRVFEIESSGKSEECVLYDENAKKERKQQKENPASRADSFNSYVN